MSTFLAELGKKLAERWVAVVALPGLLFLSALAVAGVLGHAHALDWRRLVAAVPAGVTPTRLTLLAVVVLVAASAVGLVAQGSGHLAETFLTGRARGPLRWFARLRRRRWEARDRAYEEARDTASPQRQAELAAARNRIALAAPDRFTWVGDRVRAAGVRVHHQYGLDVAFSWTALWLVLPAEVKADITEARAALRDAVVLGAWGVAYLGIGVRWWPMAPVALAVIASARNRVRAAADAYAGLVEAAYDLHVADLAEKLGVQVPDRVVTPELGRQVDEHLRKGS